MSEGRKDDQGKTRYELLPPELLDGTARVLTFGAAKYDDRNWEKGMAWSRPFGALMRHMWAWWRGEANDPETGMSHLWHASCCLSFLIAYEQRKVGTDDRPVPTTISIPKLPTGAGPVPPTSIAGYREPRGQEVRIENAIAEAAADLQKGSYVKDRTVKAT